MRPLLASFLFVGGIGTDPCTRLCEFDGPQICAGGSWTKGGGICHAYYHNAYGYCYHTAVTKVTCPTSGLAVRASEVDGLIAARGGAVPQATISTTAAPKSFVRQTTVPPTEPAATTTEAPFVYPLEMNDLDISDLIDTPETALVNGLKRKIVNLVMDGLPTPSSWLPVAKDIVNVVRTAVNVRDDSLATYIALKGRVLLHIVSRPEVKGAAVALPFMLAANMPATQGEALERFVTESGIGAFCASSPKKVKDGLLQHFRGVEAWRTESVSHERLPHLKPILMLERFCPQLLASSFELRRSLVVAAAWISVPQDPAFHHLVIQTPRETPLTDAKPFIHQTTQQSLRLQVTASFADSTTAFDTQEWFAGAIAEMIGTTPGDAVFVKNQTTNLFEVFARDPRNTNFGDVGAFIAVCLLHNRPLGVRLPIRYVASMLGSRLTVDMMDDEDTVESRTVKRFLALPIEILTGLGPQQLGAEELVITEETRRYLAEQLLNGQGEDPSFVPVQTLALGFGLVLPRQIVRGLLSAKELVRWFAGEVLE